MIMIIKRVIKNKVKEEYKLITGEQLKAKFKEMPDKTTHAVAESLRQFGYQGLTNEFVKDKIESILKGETQKEVIGMFLEGWFKNGID